MAKYIVDATSNKILDGEIRFDSLAAANQFFNSLFNVLQVLDDHGGTVRLLSEPTNGSTRILKDSRI